MSLSHYDLSSGDNSVLVGLEVTAVMLLTGGTAKRGVDGVSCDGAFSGVGENGVAFRGDNAEFDNGIAADPVGGEGGSGWW